MQPELKTANLSEIVFDEENSLQVEYDGGTKEPMALIETAIDRGQEFELTSVIRRLAMRISPPVPAYVVLYTPAPHCNPADPVGTDIASLRVRRIWPEPVTPWEVLTSQEWATRLCHLRHGSAIPNPLRET